MGPYEHSEHLQKFEHCEHFEYFEYLSMLIIMRILSIMSNLSILSILYNLSIFLFKFAFMNKLGLHACFLQKTKYVSYVGKCPDLKTSDFSPTLEINN